jgi:ABC-2 type transport system permease protein
MTKVSSTLKRSAIFNLILIIALIIALNVLGAFKFGRLDLTSEKRYTLSKTTIALLENLKDYVYVKVYLEGELPANYKQLRNSTKEMLDEFRAYTPYLEYEFINPSENAEEKERFKIYKQLSKEGLSYTTPVEQKEAGISQKLIWPGAIFTYRGKSIPLQLLKSETYANEEQMISRAVTDLEYEMTNTIRKLNANKKPTIAFIEGHGELDSLETKDITLSLEEYYSVSRVRIDSNLTSLVYRGERDTLVKFVPRFKAIIIAQPDSAFSEKDKFIIDQYILRGGKVLWVLDRVSASMDSLSRSAASLVYPLDLNLDDQLFKYGARINSNLVMDLRSSVIPVIVGRVGNQPRYKPKRWPYFPLATPLTNHPIVNNLNATRFEFASSVDTVAAQGISKTVLLSSSKRTQLINAPARISLNILKEQPDARFYNLQNIPLAVLLEGKFTSNFKNRIPPAIQQNKQIGFVAQSELESAMIVVADGDVIKNGVSRTTGRLSPLGLDKYTGEMFGNRDFILNCMNYLCDDSGLISVRARVIKTRILDETKVKNERTNIQLKNVLLPLILISFLGIVLSFIRKRKFGAENK